MKRLSDAGLAERQSKRRYVIPKKIPKRSLKKARA